MRNYDMLLKIDTKAGQVTVSPKHDLESEILTRAEGVATYKSTEYKINYAAYRLADTTIKEFLNGAVMNLKLWGFQAVTLQQTTALPAAALGDNAI